MVQTIKLNIAVVLLVFAGLATALAPNIASANHMNNPTSVNEILAQIVVVLEDLIESKGDEPSTETAAADLRVTLNGLLKERVNLGMVALYAVIDDADHTEEAVEALDENSVELAETIGSVYGDYAEEAFLKIWRDHIGFFANYAVGLREGDPDMRDEAEDDLEQYQQDISDFFSGAIPLVEEDVVIAGAGEHKDLLIEAMEEYEDGSYEDAFAAQREADKQISGIANLLAKGIVMQFPGQF